MQVVVDGVEYAPAGGGGASFGVAISTHNRPELVAKHAALWRELSPPGTPVLVVDDGSSPPVPGADFRFSPSRGIVAVKNKSIELLMDDAKVDHLFLVDDDCYPLVAGWWKPYVESPEHHLSYQFEDLRAGSKLRDVAKIWDDGEHVAYTGQRGLVLYYTRQAIEACGGMDQIYGRGYYEHVDLAHRIHEAGLTSFCYMDVAGSDELIHSMDEWGEVTRATPTQDHAAQVARNANVFNSRRDARDFPEWVPFREPRSAVVTCLLTASTDPQRGTTMAADYKLVSALHGSVQRAAPGAEMVLLRDNPVAGLPGSITDVEVSGTGNPYFQRWAHVRRWLRDNPAVEQAVVCDATDVEFLRDPFPLIPADRLVVGEEWSLLDDTAGWMRKNHSWDKLSTLFDERGREQMLNAGILAGPSDLIIRFIDDLLTEWEHYEFDLFNGKRRAASGMVGDMPIFNLVARRHKVVHGPQWTTRFKGEERNDFSVFKHK